MKVVHGNLLLPLFSDPSDQANESDDKFMVDPTISTQVVIVAGVVNSDVHNLSTYGRGQVTDMFPKKDWGLLQLCLNNGNTVTYWV